MFSGECVETRLLWPILLRKQFIYLEYFRTTSRHQTKCTISFQGILLFTRIERDKAKIFEKSVKLYPFHTTERHHCKYYYSLFKWVENEETKQSTQNRSFEFQWVSNIFGFLIDGDDLVFVWLVCAHSSLLYALFFNRLNEFGKCVNPNQSNVKSMKTIRQWQNTLI